VQQLTEVSFHAQRLVLLELCNGTAKQRNDGALHTTQLYSHQPVIAVQHCITQLNAA